MHRYKVLLDPQAQRQIQDIHDYIFSVLGSPNAAASNEDAIFDTIMSLETMPDRGNLREVGPYADGRHRTVHARGYTIVYTVEADVVYVLAVRYSASDF